MRAITVRPPNPGATLADVPRPPVGSGEVRVRVLECGVCGTDRDIVAGKYGTAPPGSPTLILGHENLGRVDEVGAGVAGFSPGDLVVATVRRGCGVCRFCNSGRSDFCESGQFTERGIRGRDGYMAEAYTDVPQYLVKVPESLRSVAVLLEPLSVVEKALDEGRRVLDRREPTAGFPSERPATALVAGTGAIGLLAVLALRSSGWAVTAIDRHGDGTPAAALVRRVGASHVDASAGVGALGGSRFDLVVEATGSAPLDFDLVSTLGPNGALVLTGIPSSDVPAFPVDGGRILRDVVLGNQAVVGSVNANRSYFEAGIADLTAFRAKFGDAVDDLVTQRQPMDAYAPVLGGREGGSIKTVLVVSPS